MTNPPWQVDRDVAHDVAHWFLRTPTRTIDRLVEAAYSDLQIQSDLQFVLLTDPTRPLAYRVVWTMERVPYADATELIAAVRGSGLLEVTAARTESERLHPLLDCTIGGPYDRFRAVHDILGHVRTGYGFDRDAEYSAWVLQSGLYRGLARWALATELHAEHSVVWTTQQVPEHKAALLPLELLRRTQPPQGRSRPGRVRTRFERRPIRHRSAATPPQGRDRGSS